MKQAEDAERVLSYLSPCRSEAARKAVGSYYTPTDVALFFWNEFFALNNIMGNKCIADFWDRHHFVEPSAGAGALVLALLKKGVEMGLTPQQLASTDLTIIDINQPALDFIGRQLSWFGKRWGISFEKIRYICHDFRECVLPVSPKAPLYFGNPPFVSNPKESKWKNLFADFLERAIQQSGPEGQCHFILPVSIAFSRDYSQLREKIRYTGKSVALSSFDNIPDTLFFNGKPQHTNTNRANSQRCSILTVFPSDSPRILSTQMHRWRKADRAKLLSAPLRYHDVTGYDFDSQFPRPENELILRYLRKSANSPRFKTLLSENGEHKLFISSVSRNFIGFRENADSVVNQLNFDTKKAMYSALLILTSDLFMDYWRSVGDGFHVTKTNIREFPIHDNLMKHVIQKTAKGRRMWKKRTLYEKSKNHPNGITVSYDFTSVAISLAKMKDV